MSQIVPRLRFAATGFNPKHVARACQPSLRARPHPGCSTESWITQRGGGGYVGYVGGGMLDRVCGIRMSSSNLVWDLIKRVSTFL
jgi:hypothetical protein